MVHFSKKNIHLLQAFAVGLDTDDIHYIERDVLAYMRKIIDDAQSLVIEDALTDNKGEEAYGCVENVCKVADAFK